MTDGELKKVVKTKGFVQYTGDGKKVQQVPILVRQLDVFNVIDEAKQACPIPKEFIMLLTRKGQPTSFSFDPLEFAKWYVEWFGT